jgi:hypothetical protein
MKKQLNEIEKMQHLAGINEEKMDIKSRRLIKQLNTELDIIVRKYNGKLSRNDIKSEFNIAMGKI